MRDINVQLLSASTKVTIDLVKCGAIHARLRVPLKGLARFVTIEHKAILSDSFLLIIPVYITDLLDTPLYMAYSICKTDPAI